MISRFFRPPATLNLRLRLTLSFTLALCLNSFLPAPASASPSPFHPHPHPENLASPALATPTPASTPANTPLPPILSQPRQLTFEGKRSGEGYFSPDGKSLVFQSEREPDNPFYQIYTLNLETGDTQRISPGHGKTTCAFFRPHSTDILFASTHLDPDARTKQKAELDFRASGKQRRYSWDYDESMDIFVARPGTPALSRLTDAPGYDAEGAYSPDGKLIVFCSLRNAYPTNQLSAEDLKRLETDPAWFGEIYLMNADGSNPRRLTSTPGYDGGPFFSPDGQRIIWRRFDSTGAQADVYTMKLDGTDVRRLTDFGAMSWAPYFHPSGQYAIFTANKLGFENFELYIVDALGKHEPVQVTDSPGFDGLPVFSPDGTRLCWTSNRNPEKQSQLYLARWDHALAQKQLNDSPQRSPGAPSTAAPSPSPTTNSTLADSPNPTPNSKTRLLPEVAWNDFQTSIRQQDLRAQVSFLASDILHGRMTGTPGARIAADYIAEHLQRAGFVPLPGSSNFFHTFDFISGSELVQDQNSLHLRLPDGASETFTLNQDFRPLSFSENGESESPVVFAGYGLVMPGKAGEGYDSYAGLNVSNKWVLLLRYVPEGVTPERRQQLNRYAGLRYKAMMARERGARGILVVTGPQSPNAGELLPLTSDGSLSGSGIMAASVSTRFVEKLLQPTGKSLQSIQLNLDQENPHSEPPPALNGSTVTLKITIRHLRRTDRNVIAMIPPGSDLPKPEYVMLGAHYDHLGHGDGNSLQRKGEEGQIHHGADDNASGVSTLLELAASLAPAPSNSTIPSRRGLILAFWSGEEIGLLGSSQFAQHPPLSPSQIIAYLNFDMVGRLRENKLQLQGIGSSTSWRKSIERKNVAAGFDLTLQDDPYLPTDVTSIYPLGIPALSFFTGSHEDYHRPTDRPETINYEGLERIATFAQSIVQDLLTPATPRPDYVQVQKSQSGGSRETLRAYLGTIPDYSSEVKGLKLSGVRGGSPADKAGLKGGDVIVKFGAQNIANIYDYTYALDAVKIGVPVEVVVERQGTRVTLTVTPEARK